MSHANTSNYYLVSERHCNDRAKVSSVTASQRRQSFASSDYGSFSDSDLSELARITDATANTTLPASRGAAAEGEDSDEDMLGGDDEDWKAMELDALDSHPPAASTDIPQPTAAADFQKLLEGLTEADLEYSSDFERELENKASSAQLLYEARIQAGDPDSPVPAHAPTIKATEDDVFVSSKGIRRRKKDRAPVEMFRTNRLLSVSDLTAGEWCEQKFEYNMVNFGAIPRTAQMAKGTEVHEKLEAEVHEIVPVKTVIREDIWAVKLWNIVYGINSMRREGRTRELPLFGVMRGRAITGYVDEINFDGEAIAVTDQKTRHSKGLPSKGSSTRGPEMQLMLYHRMLVDLPIADYKVVLEQLRLDGDTVFSDELISQLCQMNPDDEHSSLILKYNTLNRLFPYAQEIFEENVKFVEDELTIEYLSGTGEVVGQYTIMNDERWLEGRLNAALDWWEGKRKAVGVEPNEAWKCRHCDFADDCEWRSSKAQEYVSRKRAERAAAAAAALKEDPEDFYAQM